MPSQKIRFSSKHFTASRCNELEVLKHLCKYNYGKLTTNEKHLLNALHACIKKMGAINAKLHRAKQKINEVNQLLK